MKKSGIYAIQNIGNGTIYIGQSLNIDKRLGEHRYLLEHKWHHNPHLQNAWEKYGSDNFSFQTVERCDADQLNEKEIYYISEYAKNGKMYNMREGGANGKTAEETKEKIRQANLGRPGTMKGKNHSDESKRKISESNMGRKMSALTKQKLIEYNTGRVVTEETKQKIRQARKKQVITEETRRKIGIASKGRKYGPRSEETKEKLRQAQLGRKASEETKIKISQSNIGKHRLSKEAKCKLSEERKGQNGPMAKLKDEQIYEIKIMIMQGQQGKTIADMFNVSQQTICDIKHGRTWKHITVDQIKETIKNL